MQIQEKEYKKTRRPFNDSSEKSPSTDSVCVPVPNHLYSHTHSVLSVGKNKGKIFSFKPSSIKKEEKINYIKTISNDDHSNIDSKSNEENKTLLNEVKKINDSTKDLRNEFNSSIHSLRKEMQSLNENLLLVAKNIQNWVVYNHNEIQY